MRSILFITLCSLTASCHLLAEESVDRQQAVEFSVQVPETVQMNHWLYLPENYEQQEQWPLLVFLHGAGERGDDLQKVKVHGPPRLIAEGHEFPFIVVSPQCVSNQRWNPDAVAHLVDHLCEKYKIDRQRMYLTGLSMGGYGTWATLAAHPKLFAAAAPICGGGDPNTVAQFKHVPLWVFHGAKDSVVPLRRSQEMVDALQAVGGNVKLTVYPEAEHDSWTESYANDELYQFLLQHQRP